MEQQRHPAYVDSGYAWVIAFSSTVVTFFQIGLVNVLGVCVPQLEEQLQISASVVGLCSGIGMGLRGISGPAWSALTRTFTSRKLVVVGGVISCLGMVAVSVSETVPHLAFSMALLSIGSGVPSVAKMVAVKQYFVKHFNLAVSLSFTGGTLGLLVLPLLIEYFEVTFGWRGAILIYGAMNLHICVAGALMVSPPSSNNHQPEDKSVVAVQDNTDNQMVTGSFTGSNLLKYAKRLFNSFGFSVLSHNGFLVVYLLAMGFNELVLTGWALFLVSYAVSHGFTTQAASIFSGAGGAGALIGRLLIGPLSVRMSGLTLFFLLAVGGTISLSCYPLCQTYWALMGISFMAGMFLGSATPAYMVLLKETFPDNTNNFASAVGLHYMFRGVGQLLGGPLTGWVYDATVSFEVSYVVLALLEGVTAALTLTKRPMKGCSKYLAKMTERKSRKRPNFTSGPRCNHTDSSTCICSYTVDFTTNNTNCIVSKVDSEKQLSSHNSAFEEEAPVSGST